MVPMCSCTVSPVVESPRLTVRVGLRVRASSTFSSCGPTQASYQPTKHATLHLDTKQHRQGPPLMGVSHGAKGFLAPMVQTSSNSVSARTGSEA